MKLLIFLTAITLNAQGPALPGPGLSGAGVAGIALEAHSIGHAVDNAVTNAVNTTGAAPTTFIACVVSAYTSGPANDFKDSKGNTWLARTVRTNTSGFNRLTLYYSIAPTVGSGHTFTNDTVGSYSTVICEAFSGVKITSTYESENGADDVVFTVAPVTGGAVTPNSTGDLIISAMNWSYSGTTATFTVDNGFSISDQFHTSIVTEGGAMAWKVATNTSAINPAWLPSTTGTTAIENAVFAKQ